MYSIKNKMTELIATQRGKYYCAECLPENSDIEIYRVNGQCDCGSCDNHYPDFYLKAQVTPCAIYCSIVGRQELTVAERTAIKIYTEKYICGLIDTVSKPQYRQSVKWVSPPNNLVIKGYKEILFFGEWKKEEKIHIRGEI